MYLLNKYTTWYNNIITQAQRRVNQTGYTEKHHIIPKSLGGSNDSSNLVRLTAKEHFVCHRLLVKMTTGNDKRKMANAAWCMAHLKNPYQNNRYKVTSNIYASLKPYIKRSPETIEKVRAKLKGRKCSPRTPEHSAKLGRYIRTEEHRHLISENRKAQIGLHKRSAETKFKMSAWQKGVPKPTKTCEHCNKTISDLNYKRWHGINCKLNNH
jgi:hypothetical protein